MPPPPHIVQRITDWKKVRETFIEEPEKLSYAEIAGRFSIPEERVRRAAADEGWPLLRLKRLERALTESDTASALLAVAEGDRLLRDNIRNVVVAGLQAMQDQLAAIDEEKKPSAKRRLVGDVMFQLLNACNALKAAGIAVPSTKGRAGGEEGGSAGEAWARGLMQQLNVAVTVNGQKTSNECPTVQADTSV